MNSKLQTIALVLAFDKKPRLHVWLQKRLTRDELHAKWELPGGKVERNESPLSAACREFKEEVGECLKEEELRLMKIHHHSEGIGLIFHIFAVERKMESLDAKGWVNCSGGLPKDILDHIPAENHRFLPNILENL